MTREEKRAAIREFCMNIDGCDSCRLKDAVREDENCFAKADTFGADADIDRNYAILFEGAEPKRVYGDGHASCGLEVPLRLDVLAGRPARAMRREDAESEGAQGINVNLNVHTEGVEEAIGQLKELNELILKAQVIAEGLSESLKRLEIIVS